MSNFGKALEKVVKRPDEISDGRNGNFQKQFEYEDRVTVRRVEASEQIKDMYQPRLYNKRERKALRFISADDNPSQTPVLEEMRNIISRGHGSNGTTTLITSVTESPSVNVFARNLAAILVKDESVTTLLIDLLGSKETIQLSESSDQAGLSDYINNNSVPIKNVIYPTGIERMRVIPYGSQDYSTGDLIRTTRMRMLLKDVTKKYRERHTIIVAPSIPRVADVELLNEYVNQIILAIPYGKSSKKDLIKSMAKLDRSKFLGTVMLDMVPPYGLLANVLGVS